MTPGNDPTAPSPTRVTAAKHLVEYSDTLPSRGLLGSMVTAGDALNNAVAESVLASLQCKLLDRHHWPTRARAIL